MKRKAALGFSTVIAKIFWKFFAKTLMFSFSRVRQSTLVGITTNQATAKEPRGLAHLWRYMRYFMELHLFTSLWVFLQLSAIFFYSTLVIAIRTSNIEIHIAYLQRKVALCTHMI